MDFYSNTRLRGFFKYKVFDESGIKHVSDTHNNLILNTGLQALSGSIFQNLIKVIDFGTSTVTPVVTQRGILGSSYPNSNLFTDLSGLSASETHDGNISTYTVTFKTYTTDTPIYLREFAIKPGANTAAFARQRVNIDLGRGDGVIFEYTLKVLWPSGIEVKQMPFSYILGYPYPASPTPTTTPTPTVTPTNTITPTVTPTNTITQTITPTNTPTPSTSQVSPSPTPTLPSPSTSSAPPTTPSPTVTQSIGTVTPTSTPPTPTPTRTGTPTPTPTISGTPSPTPTPTSTGTPTPTPTPTNTPTPTSSNIPVSGTSLTIPVSTSYFRNPGDHRIFNTTYTLYALSSNEALPTGFNVEWPSSLGYTTSNESNSYAVQSNVTYMAPNSAVAEYTFGPLSGYGQVKSLLLSNGRTLNDTNSGFFGMQWDMPDELATGSIAGALVKSLSSSRTVTEKLYLKINMFHKWENY